MAAGPLPAKRRFRVHLAAYAADAARRSARTLLLAFTASTIAAASPARSSAQQLDLTLFAPPPQPAVTFTIPEPIPLGARTFHVGLTGDYASQVVELSHTCRPMQPGDRACASGAAEARGQVVWTAHSALLLELALFDKLSLGARLPLALARGQTTDLVGQTYAGLGDIGLTLSGALTAQRGTRVGWQVGATLPTAATGTFAGEPYVTVAPGFAASQALGERVVLAAQLAYHLRKRHVVFGIERDDELIAKLGLRVACTPHVAALAEVQAVFGIGGRSMKRAESPAEIGAGVRLGKPEQITLDLGVGTAAWPFQHGLGAPEIRAFMTLRGSLGPSPCTTGPEDRDGFQDADGCADPDNDADSIPDERDACPNDAEDRDGFQDEDGCPDTDNDADGLTDAQDLCPDYSEDRDGFQDGDGCPEPDNDEDNVADGSDRCRLDPEDRDGFEDDDGCPEPGPDRPSVTRAGSRLLISDRVYFEDESDTLRAVSAPLLDALAATFQELPGRPRLRVEGHTDDSGNAQYNVDLSYRRARAVVEYLKRQGIEADRLEYVGRGSSQPLGPNDSAEGRALNRRVEFVLLGGQ